MSGLIKTVSNFWQNFPFAVLEKARGLGQVVRLPCYRLMPSGAPRT